MISPSRFWYNGSHEKNHLGPDSVAGRNRTGVGGVFWRNSPLGESFLNTGIEKVAGDVSLEVPMGYGGAWLKSAAECFVAPNGIGETFKNPADAIGDLQGEATEVVGSRQATTNEFWAEKGFAEHRVYQDSNGDFHHLFYNPKTGQFSGGGLSSHE